MLEKLKLGVRFSIEDNMFIEREEWRKEDILSGLTAAERTEREVVIALFPNVV